MGFRHRLATAGVGLVLIGLLPADAQTVFPSPAGEGVDNIIEVPRPVRLSIDFETIQAATETERDGDVEEALRILDGGIERRPKDGTLIAARGAVHLQGGDLVAARADFERAIAANSHDPSGFAGLCVLAVLEGAPMRIEDHCRAARNRNIVDPVYGQIAMATTIMGANLGAVEVRMLDTLAVANPYVPAIRLLSLEVCLSAGNSAMARGDLRLLWQVYELPGDAPPRILDRIAAFKLADIVGADIPCYLALAEVEIDRHEGKTSSSARIEQAFACEPDNETLRADRVEQLNRGALAARDNGDYVQAISLLQEATALEPTDPALLDNLAHVAFEGGDPATAEAALLALLTLTPDDPELRYNYGVCLVALGREEEARPFLQGLESSPR
jgi:Flp pilus assembly protein TadD